MAEGKKTTKGLILLRELLELDQESSEWEEFLLDVNITCFAMHQTLLIDQPSPCHGGDAWVKREREEREKTNKIGRIK